MNTKQLLRQQTTTKRMRMENPAARLLIWRAVRGLWKKKKINAVRYQRKVRDEADHATV